jgi:radical SAM superfamily enzyme YgiQ (UPF0313 family)
MSTKVLLGILPFWDPQVPPVGISCLKSFVRQHGYAVKTVDFNVDEVFRELYRQYFEILKKYIPENRGRHLYNLGHDVLRNHLMAHLNYEDEEEYIRLVKQVVANTFFSDPDPSQVRELNRIPAEFYRRLGALFLPLLESEKPGVLGLSVYSGTLPASLFAFKLAKEKFPHIKTVMGGGIFSGELSMDNYNFGYFLEKVPYIDKIIVGEGELLFLKLLRGELPGTQRVFTLKDIDNRVLDITAVDIPDFSDFELQYFTVMANYTSRSCPFQCNFCVETVYWGKYRKKRAAQILEELASMYKKYRHQLFLMCDSLLNPVITPLAGEMIKSDFSLYWEGYLRADKEVGNTGNTMLWRRGGFYRARLGVESGSQRILDLMGKKITVEQIKSAVHSLAYAGIKTTTYWVIGYPGETEGDFRMTLSLIEELKDDIYEADCNPFWYFYGGQVNSGEWSEKNRSIPLYPRGFLDMLILQTWILDAQPSREETYKRVNRFIEHLDRLGIPNPYTLDEVYRADRRWENLHKNAVPPLLKFQDRDRYIDECKSAVEYHTMPVNPREDEGDFGF